LSGDEGDGGVEPLLESGVELLEPGIELPVLDSVPPGDVAPPVDDPGVIPKWEYTLCRQVYWLISGQLL